MTLIPKNDTQAQATLPAVPTQVQLVSATDLVATVIAETVGRLEEIFDHITVVDSDWYAFATLVATAIPSGVMLEPAHAVLLQESIGEHIAVDHALSSGDESWLDNDELTISDFRREAMVIATWINSCDRSKG